MFLSNRVLRWICVSLQYSICPSPCFRLQTLRFRLLIYFYTVPPYVYETKHSSISDSQMTLWQCITVYSICPWRTRCSYSVCPWSWRRRWLVAGCSEPFCVASTTLWPASTSLPGRSPSCWWALTGSLPSGGQSSATGQTPVIVIVLLLCFWASFDKHVTTEQLGWVHRYQICNFWHPGTLTISPKRQSAWMSKITNDGLIRSGAGCFIAVYTHMAVVESKG